MQELLGITKAYNDLIDPYRKPLDLAGRLDHPALLKKLNGQQLRRKSLMSVHRVLSREGDLCIVGLDSD